MEENNIHKKKKKAKCLNVVYILRRLCCCEWMCWPATVVGYEGLINDVVRLVVVLTDNCGSADHKAGDSDRTEQIQTYLKIHVQISG